MTDQGTDNSDDLFMLDLFRSELETGVGTLDQGLVGLESGQSRETMDAIVRAAHSIKGAARIVGLNSIVSIAGVMENMLTSIRDGKIIPGPEHSDLLREGTDFFRKLSALNTPEIPDSLKKEEPTIDTMCEQLQDLL